MITNLLIDWAIVLFGAVFALMPDFTAVVDQLNAAASTLGASVGPYLGMASPLVPADMIIAMIVYVATLLPVLAAYRLFSWIWRHVPTIAGFGTGGG